MSTKTTVMILGKAKAPPAGDIYAITVAVNMLTTVTFIPSYAPFNRSGTIQAELVPSFGFRFSRPINSANPPRG
jgi:hypothetical protein